MQTKVTHLSSAHQRYDTRIFIKMCSSLAKNKNYEVSLVVADGKNNEVKNGIKIYDVGKPPGRIKRMLKTTKSVYHKAVDLDADIYHLHDPELIPIGLKLKKKGKKVIFDAHEDLPKQILGKPYLIKPVKVILSNFLGLYEKFTLKKFDYIISATPYIKDKFLKITPYTVDVNNFPILDELSNKINWKNKKNEVCYVGAVTKIRGVKELVEAIDLTSDIKLNLAGIFNDKNIEDEVKSNVGWQKVNELGFLDRTGILTIYKHSKAGLVTLHPIINYLDALPVKMFEYMAAGLPVISSNIPLWKKIVEENNCGICVNPLGPKEIADAIEYIISNPQKAEQMGKNGKQAVIKKYNWAIEERKLFDVYEKIR